MPSAIQHDHELASKGLVTILVEAQGAEQPLLEAFLWQRFPDNDCFSCINTFVPIPESRGIPHAAVVGVDGTLLWAGNPSGDPKKVEELIAGELVKVKKGWGNSVEAKKVRAALYGKDDLAGAAAILAAMPEGEERTALQAEIDTRFKAAMTAVTTLKDQGRWLAAQARAKSLLKSVGTRAEWVGTVAPLVTEFDSETAKAELALEKKLEKVTKQLRDGKGENAPKALQALLKDGANTRVGERAQRLLTALQTPLKS